MKLRLLVYAIIAALFAMALFASERQAEAVTMACSPVFVPDLGKRPKKVVKA